MEGSEKGLIYRYKIFGLNSRKLLNDHMLDVRENRWLCVRMSVHISRSLSVCPVHMTVNLCCIVWVSVFSWECNVFSTWVTLFNQIYVPVSVFSHPHMSNTDCQAIRWVTRTLDKRDIAQTQDIEATPPWEKWALTVQSIVHRFCKLLDCFAALNRNGANDHKLRLPLCVGWIWQIANTAHSITGTVSRCRRLASGACTTCLWSLSTTAHCARRGPHHTVKSGESQTF